MATAERFFQSLDYGSDIYSGDQYDRRKEAWDRLASSEKSAVLRDLIVNGPWYVRRYMQRQNLPFDREDLAAYLLGVFSDWQKYSLGLLRPSMNYTPRPNSETERIGVLNTRNFFAKPSTTLMHSFYGASRNLKTVMHVLRIQGTLPPRQLAIMQWTYLHDICGIYRAIADNESEYFAYINQRYLAALHGDGKARVDFQIVENHGDSFEGMFPEVCRKIEYHYVPDFEEVWANLLAQEIQVAARDNDAIGQFAREILGGNSGRGVGWATSR